MVLNGSNTIIKFIYDPMVVGLIRKDDETAYRDEVQHLALGVPTTAWPLRPTRPK